MNSQQGYEWLAKTKVMAGMRGAFDPDTAVKTAEILLKYDISVFEMTMNSSHPIAAMQAIKKAFGQDAVVGMGTVLNVEDAQRVLDAGADFVVSPAFQPAVVRVIQAADKLVAPGVATPSEAVAAWAMDVKLLKLFPIGALGLDYFKAMFGPLKHMKFMCNGAMHAENAHAFLQAGAVAAGMAGWLTGNGHTPLDMIHRRATQMQQAVKKLDGAFSQQA